MMRGGSENPTALVSRRGVNYVDCSRPRQTGRRAGSIPVSPDEPRRALRCDVAKLPQSCSSFDP
jgi:hypothetical protein